MTPTPPYIDIAGMASPVSDIFGISAFASDCVVLDPSDGSILQTMPVGFGARNIAFVPELARRRARADRAAHPRARSVPGASVELPVLDPVRLVGVGAEAARAVRLVVLVVALEPLDVAVALEGEDVGGDAVEEPAVVARSRRRSRRSRAAPPRARAACRRRGRWSARRAAARCRRACSSFARCTRLRSPPESVPTLLLLVGALEAERRRRRRATAISRLPTLMRSSPPADLLADRLRRDRARRAIWST